MSEPVGLSFLIEAWESERPDAAVGDRGVMPDFRVVVRDLHSGKIIATSAETQDFYDAVALRDAMFNGPREALYIAPEPDYRAAWVKPPVSRILDCECEHESCAQHGATDLEPVWTIYGVRKICGVCRRTHPIPARYLNAGV